MTAARGVVALVLAAGTSTRFGRDKLLEPVEGKPLGEHIAATLANLALGHYLAVCPAAAAAEARCSLYRGHGFEIVENPHAEQGMGMSLAMGARRAIGVGAETLLVCLADMPNVSADHLAALLEVDAPIVVTEANGVRSPPAVFSREFLPQLARLTGDQGARRLLRAAATVSAKPHLVRDFDTPADFD